MFGGAGRRARQPKTAPLGPIGETLNSSVTDDFIVLFPIELISAPKKDPGTGRIFLGRKGRTMKPQLPPCLCDQLPDDVLNIIQSFVPHLPKEKPVKSRSPSLSPNAERDLRIIQRKALKGMNQMYLRDLDDFVLC